MNPIILRLTLSFIVIWISFSAEAVVNVTAVQSGANVVFTASGTADTSSLGYWGGINSGRLQPNNSSFTTGAPAASGIMVRSGPTPSGSGSFGTGGAGATFVSGTGDIVGIETGNMLAIPSTYVSGAALSGSATFLGSFASLGITTGTYTWTWGSGLNADSLVLTVISPPTVTSVSPTSGSTAGGDAITITGTNFTGATAVTIGGNACSTFTVVTATSITCSTPAGTAGTASILVTTTGGTNAANSLFTYITPTYTVGGTISGLTGSGLVLADANAGSSGVLSSGATSFALSTAVNSGTNYAVTVQTQPTGQICSVSNGSGTVASSNVTNVSVTCNALSTPALSVTNSPQTYTGSAIAAAVNCSSGGAVSNVLYSGSSTVPSVAGTYAITADCAASGSYSAVTGGSAGNFVISPALSSAPSAVPSLSEWAQLVLALMTIGVAWHFHNASQSG